jgi:hypothetical protein
MDHENVTAPRKDEYLTLSSSIKFKLVGLARPDRNLALDVTFRKQLIHPLNDAPDMQLYPYHRQDVCSICQGLRY